MISYSDDFFKDNKCPICDCKMKDMSNKNVFHEIDVFCMNDCFGYLEYELSRELRSYSAFIFGIEYEFYSNEDDSFILKEKNSIKEKIRYWKENDRYLIKIMENQ